MEPKPKSQVKRVPGVANGKTTKSTSNSGGRATGKAKKVGGSVVSPPIAPPRLKSISGGHSIRSSKQHVKPKR